MNGSRSRRCGIASLALAALFGACGGEERERPSAPARAPAAAAVYVVDAVCGSCHEAIAASYAAHGMARSLVPARGAARIEDFARASFYHAPSRRHYAMRIEGADMVIRRFQRDPSGREIHAIERRIDWIVGSGNHVRAYLFREPGGEIFAAPVNWYAQEGRWGMAPGYDAADHFDFTRGITSDCLACHDAVPLSAAGAALAARPDRPEARPASLPAGIGCQRCHGPGGAHVERAESLAHPDEIRAAIVNPQHLSPERREEVCLQCHLQPTARRESLPLLPERGSFDFVPGAALASHRAVLEYSPQGNELDTFEINHHAYRLRRSACREQDGAFLSCLACHDPHGKAPLEERLQRVDRTCARCHAMPSDHASSHRESTRGRGVHCSDCHMPVRRPEDVVLARMTDHRIQRRCDLEQAIAPRREELAPPAAMVAPYPLPGTTAAHALRARVAAAREKLPEGRLALRRALESEGGDALAWAELGLAEWLAGEVAPAEAAYLRALALDPQCLPALQGAAAASLLRGSAVEAERLSARAIDLAPEHPDPHAQHAHALRLLGREAEARLELERCLAARPLFADAWIELGSLELEAQRFDAARTAYLRALEAEPRSRDGYAGLAAACERLGRERETLDYLLAEASLLPPHVPALLRLGALRLASASEEIRDVEHGLRCMREAALLAPADPIPHLWSAFGCLLIDRASEGRAELATARRLGADEATALLLEGQFARRGGREAEARSFEMRAASAASGAARAPLLRALLERAVRGQR